MATSRAMRNRRAPIRRPTESTETGFPDSILPSQYFDRIRARSSDMPEKRLMIAVLFDSIAHLQRRGSMGAMEAVRWVRGENEEPDAPFSFKNICEVLGIDPTYLARGLLGWHQGAAVARALPFRHPRICRPRIRQARRRRRPPLRSVHP